MHLPKVATGFPRYGMVMFQLLHVNATETVKDLDQTCALHMMRGLDHVCCTCTVVTLAPDIHLFSDICSRNLYSVHSAWSPELQYMYLCRCVGWN